MAKQIKCALLVFLMAWMGWELRSFPVSASSSFKEPSSSSSTRGAPSPHTPLRSWKNILLLDIGYGHFSNVLRLKFLIKVWL